MREARIGKVDGEFYVTRWRTNDAGRWYCDSRDPVKVKTREAATKAAFKLADNVVFTNA